jgi:hypothetical protein
MSLRGLEVLSASLKMRSDQQHLESKFALSKVLIMDEILVEAAGVEPASENVTGQETTCLFAFMPWALPQDVRDPRSERTRNASR